MNSKSGKQLRHYAMIAGSMVFVGVMLVPYYSIFLASLTPFSKVGSGQVLPVFLYWQNYVEIWHRVIFARFLINSIIYGLAIGLIAVFAAIPAGYAISRFNFYLKNPYKFFLLSTQMFPIVIIALPLFLIVLKIGLFNTYASIILVTSAITLPFPIWLMASYFDTTPIEMEEAAMIDGCSRRQTLFYVLVPVVAPGILTSFVLAFSTAWCQFLIPYIFLTSKGKLPVTAGIYSLVGEHVVEWNLVMTGCLIAIIPPLIVFFLAQKYVIGGLTAGAIK